MSRRSQIIVALAALASSLALLACAGTRAARAQDEPLPALGDYVYIEQLPEVIERVAPVYPVIAKQASVSGVVMVQALIGKDGLVKDTRVMKSIPMLDAAAVEAVRQWRFKPARANDRPVASWIAIPIRFDLEGHAPGDGPRGVPTPPVFEGRYRIGGDPNDPLIVTPQGHRSVRLLSPGKWKGAGTYDGRAYRGTFEYLRTVPGDRLRGARGTHVGVMQLDGSLEVDGRFTNREWRSFHVRWVKAAGDVTALPRIPIIRDGTGYENPTWPPQSRTQVDSTHEHPLWPPEHTQRDFQTVPASTDSTKH